MYLHNFVFVVCELKIDDFQEILVVVPHRPRRQFSSSSTYLLAPSIPFRLSPALQRASDELLELLLPSTSFWAETGSDSSTLAPNRVCDGEGGAVDGGDDRRHERILTEYLRCQVLIGHVTRSSSRWIQTWINVGKK